MLRKQAVYFLILGGFLLCGVASWELLVRGVAAADPTPDTTITSASRSDNRTPPPNPGPANPGQLNQGPSNQGQPAVTPSLPGQPASTPPAGAAAASTIDIPTGINLRHTVTVQVVQKTKDAVVNISTRKLVNQHVIQGDQFWHFDTGQVVRAPANSLGSGFIIQRDGYVVTNNHVVDKAREISVELADGRKLNADLVGADPDADLAILRIHSDKPFPTLELGESSDLMIGEPVIAVGNPFGFSHSVSTGIVSSLHRDIGSGREEPGQQPIRGEDAALHDLIQTDAAINPGNSGGPLLNAYGQVIGMNTAIKSGAQNIGFAIPIDRLRDLIPELMDPSQVIKVDVPVKLVEHRTMIEPATVISQVLSTGKNPQVLASINGSPVGNIIDAYAALLQVKARQPFEITWAGNSSTGDRTEKITAQPTPIPDAVVQARQRFGLTIEQATPMLAEKMGLSQEDGLLVDAVDRSTPAFACGIRSGDVIVQFGGVRITNLDDFGALCPRLPESGQIKVWVVRGQELGFVILKF